MPVTAQSVVRSAGSIAVVLFAVVACDSFGEDTVRADDAGAPASEAGPSANDDASTDANPSPDSGSVSPGDCWSLRPAHYDPCIAGFDDAHPRTAAKVVQGGTITLRTDASDTIADGAATYGLFRFDSLTVAEGGTLRIEGPYPALIIVDGEAVIAGRIEVAPPSGPAPAACDPLDMGTTITNCTGGAAGGGYGGVGGGSEAAASPPKGGPSNGGPLLKPLRGGCPGGKSGTPQPVSNGGRTAAEPAAGGRGGGALALSARGAITVVASASIVANGTGGGGGAAHKGGEGPCQTNDGKSCDTGGGGGGSGGAILLEGLTVTIMGAVCAVGGGGGSGGIENGVTGAGGATSQRCEPALGGTQGARGGTGGAAGDPTNGAQAACGFSSGGGGGGGVGRIRIHAKTLPGITGSVVPLAHVE